jgi:hypothetical protein
MSPQSTPQLLQLVAEVLASPIPYRTAPLEDSNGAFYFVCDYRPVPKGTVLVYSRPYELGLTINGYLPQASADERAVLHKHLAARLSAEGTLETNGLSGAGLRVLGEAEGVQRLIEVRQLMSVQWVRRDRPLLH